MEKTKQRRDIYICRRDNRVRSSLVQSNYSRRVAVAECVRDLWLVSETLASLCSLSFQATIYAQLFLDQLRYSFLPPRIPFTNEAVGFLAIATFRFFRSLVEYKLRNKGARDTDSRFIPSFLSTFGWRISRKNEMKRNGKGWRCSRFFFWIE